MDADHLAEELNQLLRDQRYWTASARADAATRFDPRVVSIFFEKLEPDSYDPMAIRDEVIELPASTSSKYRRALLLGTTGAGKTTAVRQIIGTDPDTERFPSTSTAKTTVADTEIVIAPGPYRAVVTFLSEDEVRDYLQECVSAAVLAAYKSANDSEVLRKLLNHINQRARFSYVLGTGPSAITTDDIDNLPFETETAPVDDGDISDPIDTATTNAVLTNAVEQLRAVAQRHGEALRRELVASGEQDERVIDELFEEGLDSLLREDEDFHQIVDALIDEIRLRFEARSAGKTHRSKQGWLESWQWETTERGAFLKEVRRFASNDARLFGQLLTPLVNGIRVAGPFHPAWDDSRQPALVLIDTEGLGHTPDSSASISTSVSRRLDEVDAVVLVDNAAQPMQAAPIAAMRALVSSGNGSKLLFCFTHFDLVRGPNLPTPKAAEQHVLASAEGALASIGEELGPFAERLLRHRLETASVFVANIDRRLDAHDKWDKRTITQFERMLGAISTITDRPEAGPSRPTYDRLNLVLAVKAAAEGFHSSWLSRLGLAMRPGIAKEPWQRIKALNRRLAERWADEYANLRPIADLHKELQSKIYVLIQNPLAWDGTEPPDDTKQQIFDLFAEKISHRLLAVSSRRLWLERDAAWKDAFRLGGLGSTFVRARKIAHEVYDEAAPIPDIAASPRRNNFLHEVIAAVQDAADEVGVGLR